MQRTLVFMIVYIWNTQASKYMLKVNNRNTRTRCEICSNADWDVTLPLLYLSDWKSGASFFYKAKFMRSKNRSRLSSFAHHPIGIGCAFSPSLNRKVKINTLQTQKNSKNKYHSPLPQVTVKGEHFRNN